MRRRRRYAWAFLALAGMLLGVYHNHRVHHGEANLITALIRGLLTAPAAHGAVHHRERGATAGDADPRPRSPTRVRPPRAGERPPQAGVRADARGRG
jgi:hypothetical protein